MRRPILSCLALLMLAAPEAFAQQILPASVAGWNSTPVYLMEPVPPVMPVLKEDGLKATEQRQYTHGTDLFEATLYEFGDTEGAYAAYSFLRTPDMAQANITQHSSMSKDSVLVLTGNFVLSFYNVKDRQKDSDAIQLIVAEAGGHAHWGAYPALPQRLPAERLIPRSDHFLLGTAALSQLLPIANGDWLGLSRGAEAELARYRLDGRDATFVIADYPTPQMAAAQLSELQTKLGVVSMDSTDNTGAQGAVSATGRVYAHRDGTMIALVVNAPSQKAASFLLDRFHSGLVLTWNVPVLEKAQPSMVTIVIGTFEGAGEICLFTIGGGILFAGIRLFIKRMWPGRIFDRALDLEIIELGLGGRFVKGNDLYQMRPPT
jgi:hypothetical protein